MAHIDRASPGIRGWSLGVIGFRISCLFDALYVCYPSPYARTRMPTSPPVKQKPQFKNGQTALGRSARKNTRIQSGTTTRGVTGSVIRGGHYSRDQQAGSRV